MPIPQVIVDEIIKPQGDAIDPSREHPKYKENFPTWRLYLDLYELDRTKIAALVEKFGDDEDVDRYERRQQLAAIFNYVPTIVRMVVNYIFSQQPTISSTDEALNAFIADCDGRGTSLSEWMKESALPMALVFGMVDCLVQNPSSEDAQLFISAADDQAADVSPRLFLITPLIRTDWSEDQSGEYNWIRFRDRDADDPNPFREKPVESVSYVTISRAVDPVVNDKKNAVGFWLRSWLKPDEGGDGASAGGGDKMVWLHDGGFLPTRRAAIETLYFAKSNDPDRRHFGLSKIAMIAVLTYKIIQLLSWTDEDVIANLAVFVLPGTPPVDDSGKEIAVVMNPNSIIWLKGDPKINPQMLQGSTDNMKFKTDLIDIYIREILRLAYIIGASGKVETVTSGVQAVVSRNELFMELTDLAASCDQFVYGVLALASSWLNNDDVDRASITQRATVDFYKGPYMVDPLETTIKNADALIALFSRTSPTLVREVLRQVAQTVMYNETQNRSTVFEEIDRNYKQMIADRRAMADALNAGVDAAAQDGNTNPIDGEVPTNPVADGTTS